jgi:hypothetical protein
MSNFFQYPEPSKLPVISEEEEIFVENYYQSPLYNSVDHMASNHIVADITDKTKELVTTIHTNYYGKINSNNKGWFYIGTVVSKTKEKKQYCVGGPFHGKFKAGSQVKGYEFFNKAASGDKGSEKFKTILLWEELLKSFPENA